MCHKISSTQNHSVKLCASALIAIFSLLYCASLSARILTFAIQPVLTKAETINAYKPLADYLSDATGHEVRVVGSANFTSYWQSIRKSDSYDIILDAAHFTDFRVQTQNYRVIAKLPDTVSYTLISNENVLILDEEEFIGKKFATVASPSLGGVRVEQLYPNVLRQPNLVPTSNFREALQKVQTGEVSGAMVPTPLINGSQSVNSILTTEPVPHMAISVSPKLSKKLTKTIRQALISASKTVKGKQMLEKVNFQSFEPATGKTYSGYASLLDGVWGYELLSNR